MDYIVAYSIHEEIYSNASVEQYNSTVKPTLMDTWTLGHVPSYIQMLQF